MLIAIPLVKLISNQVGEYQVRDLISFYCNSSILLLFRDGVSESQFNQVLNHELDQMIKVPFLVAYIQIGCSLSCFWKYWDIRIKNLRYE